MISQIIDGVERQVSSASSGQVTQYAIMPAYTDFTLGKIIQYTGVTNANYTKGYFYVRGTNGWEPQPVQSGGAGNVTSVNGKTGAVVLNAEDVGTSPTIVAYKETSPAAAPHEVDTYIYYDDTTYKVKAAIAIGDSLVVDTNIEALNLTEMESTVIYIPEDEGDAPVSNLSDLGDVSLSSLTNGQVIKYNSTTQKWENVSLGTATAKDSTNAVTQNSTDLVESGAVYTGLSSKADLTDLAPAFSSVNAYTIGDYVTYDGDLYKFTSAHSAGEWVAADATKVAIATEVSGKTDKVTSATAGNFAGLNASGNLTDSGSKAADFVNWNSNTRIGAHNLLKFPYHQSSKTQADIIYTVHSDGTITASGTASAEGALTLEYGDKSLTKGDYIVSMGFTGTLTTGIYIMGYNGSTYVKHLATWDGYDANGEQSFTIDYDGYDNIVAEYYVPNGTNLTTPVTVKPMIRIATDTDSTFAPYAPTNQQLATVQPELNALTNVYGSKNLLVQSAWIDASSGLTVTRNSNGSITISGTSTGAFGYSQFTIASQLTLKAGTYILTGNTINDGNCYLRVGNDDLSKQALDFGSGATLTLTADTILHSDIIIPNASGAINTTFYPMLRDARITDPTYVPYAKTNRELTVDGAELSFGQVGAFDDNTYYTNAEPAGNSYWYKYGKLVIINLIVNCVQPDWVKNVTSAIFPPPANGKWADGVLVYSGSGSSSLLATVDMYGRLYLSGGTAGYNTYAGALIYICE